MYKIEVKMPEFCVTGGTGLIAAYLIKSLLQKGHIVRTTARDPGTNMLISILIQKIQDYLISSFTIYVWLSFINFLHSTFSLTSENTEKVGYLLQLNGAKERLKIMRADLVEEGSFDAAVEGADGVFHVASPVLVPYDDNVKASPCA